MRRSRTYSKRMAIGVKMASESSLQESEKLFKSKIIKTLKFIWFLQSHSDVLAIPAFWFLQHMIIFLIIAKEKNPYEHPVVLCKIQFDHQLISRNSSKITISRNYGSILIWFLQPLRGVLEENFFQILQLRSWNFVQVTVPPLSSQNSRSRTKKIIFLHENPECSLPADELPESTELVNLTRNFGQLCHGSGPNIGDL